MIRLLMVKGEGLNTEDITMNSKERVRLSISCLENNSALGLDISTDGRIRVVINDNLSNLDEPPHTVFEGTASELLDKLVL
jgi:hypothetical protein